MLNCLYNIKWTWICWFFNGTDAELNQQQQRKFDDATGSFAVNTIPHHVLSETKDSSSICHRKKQDILQRTSITIGTDKNESISDSSLSREDDNLSFVVPISTSNLQPSPAHRPVIQFQTQLSPSNTSRSPTLVSLTQQSRRDHNIDYSTLFVQLAGTFPTLYRCVNCHKTVSNRWHHANIHRPQSHICPICAQKFTRRDNMKAHCKIKHADLRAPHSRGSTALNNNNGDQGFFYSLC